jgi:hypothetical protein
LKRLAFTLAVFWSLQVLVCLAPAAGVAAAERSALGSEAGGHSHHHVGAAQGNVEGDRAPHSHAPGANHHCAQHCASLSQTISAAPASVPVPQLSFVALAPLPASSALQRALAGAVARLEHERPPPDLLARHGSLRI